MPKKYGNIKKVMKPKNKLKKLTEAQKKKLKKHSEHHSKSHMAKMRMDMMRGKSFDEAHRRAMAKVGK